MELPWSLRAAYGMATFAQDSAMTPLYAFACMSLAALTSCGVQAADAAPVELTAFSARLVESPGHRSAAATGVGMVDATLNRSTGVLSWCLTYSGIGATGTSGRFFVRSTEKSPASTVFPFVGILLSPITGAFALTPLQISELLAGNWQVDLRSATAADGALQGALTLRP
jgi:hypothetical protein